MENYEILLVNKEIIDYGETRRVCVAPILNWADRHSRYIARQITENAWLYSEAISAGAIIYGDRDHFLVFDEGEQPVALQLSGGEPTNLARAAKAAKEYSYDETNLSCDCPGPHIQKGAFGVCLMNEVGLVADYLNAIQDAVGIPATIKHCVGVGRRTEYGVATRFVGTLYEKTACRTFTIHARNAQLDGLLPKENREAPPLKYDHICRPKRDFPELEIIINGGVITNEQISEHLEHIDGVMAGRKAYHNPMIMRDWDRLSYGESNSPVEYADLVLKLYEYNRAQIRTGHGTILRHIVRHSLGLIHRLKNART